MMGLLVTVRRCIEQGQKLSLLELCHCPRGRPWRRFATALLPLPIRSQLRWGSASTSVSSARSMRLRNLQTNKLKFSTNKKPISSAGILTPLISFRALAYTRDIPGIYQCFEIYQGYFSLSQVIPSWHGYTKYSLRPTGRSFLF